MQNLKRTLIVAFAVLSWLPFSSCYSVPKGQRQLRGRRGFLRLPLESAAAAAALGVLPVVASDQDTAVSAAAAPAAPGTSAASFRIRKGSAFDFEPGEEFCICTDGNCRGKNCDGLKRAEPTGSKLGTVSSSYESELAALRALRATTATAEN
mmetsp:Transcript_91492/g.182352  ORF Transcript_91492/g.182352 Transcript_91492/m.182352 type:complete len:152 (-) Transcript_91492:129-584(-)